MVRFVPRGFTIVELLVVIGIIGALAALLLPAIQWARESARQTHCQNNLKQQGLAVLAHVSVHKHFPTNGWGYLWIGEPDRGFGAKQPGGWIYNILPYLEGANLRTIGKRQPENARKTLLAELLQTDVAVFACPSRHAGLLPVNTALRFRNADIVPEVAKTDYAINEGDYITDTREGPESLQAGDDPQYPWTDCSRATGISFQRSAVRAAQVQAGLAHTYLIGEKYVRLTGSSSADDPGYDQPLYTGVDYDLNRWTLAVPAPDGAGTGSRQFGSAHAEHCYFTACDGHVESVKYDVDAIIHRSRGNRLAGQSRN